jgi:predicted DCC family thiol-disulfide oxidoreductase YuxK
MEQTSRGGAGSHLLLYDGECGLCDRLVQFVLPRDSRGVFRFASLQGPTGRKFLHGAPLTTVYVVADYRTARARVLAKADAALFVVRALGWPWKATAVFGVLPTALLDRGYDFVATHRYRVFGKVDQCLMPRPEFRDRFIDV